METYGWGVSFAMGCMTIFPSLQSALHVWWQYLWIVSSDLCNLSAIALIVWPWQTISKNVTTCSVILTNQLDFRRWLFFRVLQRRQTFWIAPYTFSDSDSLTPSVSTLGPSELRSVEEYASLVVIGLQQSHSVPPSRTVALEQSLNSYERCWCLHYFLHTVSMSCQSLDQAGHLWDPPNVPIDPLPLMVRLIPSLSKNCSKHDRKEKIVH
jgi:hypothetical protein